jgi:hypothetical protein
MQEPYLTNKLLGRKSVLRIGISKHESAGAQDRFQSQSPSFQTQKSLLTTHLVKFPEAPLGEVRPPPGADSAGLVVKLLRVAHEEVHQHEHHQEGRHERHPDADHP